MLVVNQLQLEVQCSVYVKDSNNVGMVNNVMGSVRTVSCVKQPQGDVVPWPRPQ